MSDAPAKRPRLISTLSIAVAVILIVILGLAILVSGGDAFSPGPVTAKQQPGVEIQGFRSHADFETQCKLCHEPLSSDLATQCLACHTAVADQIQNRSGAHGRLLDPKACAACHQEHKGREFDPLDTALKQFDHNQTAFPLTGKHAEKACADCHQDGRYDTVTPQCISCHEEPKLHAGLFGKDCDTCHTSQGWRPSSIRGTPFDHSAATFTLDRHAKNFDGTPLLCAACHNPGTNQVDAQRCIDCHAGKDLAFINKHMDQFGGACAQCHDGRDRMSNFKHDTFFPLNGKHAALECETCHAEKKFTGTPKECIACHKEPEIHGGMMGQKCQYCHTADAWQPAFMRLHGFPVDHGGKGEQTCQTCHPASYAQFDCYACHDHTPQGIEKSHAKAGIPADQLSDCAACHLDGQVHKVVAP